jgi:hypothetical protein
MYGFESPSFLFLTLFSPIGTVLFMVFISFGMIGILKDRFENIMYNTSRTASYGGCAVILVIWIGSSLLHKGNIPSAFTNWVFHSIALAFSIWIAVKNIRTNLKKEPGKKETVADTYHNWFLLPGYIYLVISLLPVIWKCGSIVDYMLTVFATIVFLLMGEWDKRTGRLDQPKHMRNNGYRFD